MGERFHILSILPPEGNWVTFKILRKLKETLAPDEKENEEYRFEQEYRCSFMSYDDRGKREQCEYTEVSLEPPKCPIHDKLCIPNGRLFWKDELAGKEKEIWLGDKARSLIVSALKELEDGGRLSEEAGTGQLYEKFVKSEEDQED